MNNKSQALIISIWVLVILVIMVVACGRQVGLNVRLVRYQKDSLLALWRAKSAVNLAIYAINKDNNNFDSLKESWAKSDDAFKQEYRASYVVLDEGSKININTASGELLNTLLQKNSIVNPQELVNNILIWRGTIPDVSKVYETMGYPAKAAKFSNIGEIRLVKDITDDDVAKITGQIAVYGNGAFNINTVFMDVLAAVLSWQIPRNPPDAQALAGKLDAYRKGADGELGTSDDNVYTNISDLQNTPGLTPEEEAAILTMVDIFSYKTVYFKIEATGEANSITRKITVIYNKDSRKAVFWHEE